MKQTKRFEDIDNYLKLFLFDESECLFSEEIRSYSCLLSPQAMSDVIDSQLEETFSRQLFGFIQAKNKNEVDIYKKAQIDRKLFSKIRSNDYYKPRKNTVIAFCLALELSLEESRQLLDAAGFTLSHSSKFDLIIEYFISNCIYDFFEINEALFEFCKKSL